MRNFGLFKQSGKRANRYFFVQRHNATNRAFIGFFFHYNMAALLSRPNEAQTLKGAYRVFT